MRLISLFFILALSAACGKQSSSGGSSGISYEKGVCNLNGASVPCASMKTADGEGVDLLESMVDVPARVGNNEIVFQADRSNKNLGRRIECGVEIRNGSTYQYNLQGDRLFLTTPEGSYEMRRLNEGSSINGTWVWKGYVDEGTHMIRQMTILGGKRVIMKHSCEL